MRDLLRKKWRNTVILRIQCPTPEKFINRCLTDGIMLEDIRRTDVLTIVCTMSSRDFFRLPKLVRGLHCRVRILRKTGFYRSLLTWRKRPMFFLGLAATVLFFIFMSGFVWNIQGPDGSACDLRILQELQKHGIVPGIRLDSFDAELLKESIIAEDPKLAWVGLDLRGTTLFVDVRYRTEKPEVIPLDSPCSVYAERDGVLTDLYVYKGTPAAENGTTVHRGDLLVSAEVPVGKDGRYLLNHAMADARAQTWYDLTAATLFSVAEKHYIGLEESVTYGIFCGRKIKIAGDYGKTQAGYDIIIEEIYAADDLPLRVIRETHRYYEEKTLPVSADLEEPRLRDELTQLLGSSLEHGGITTAEMTVADAQDRICVRLRCECYEDIGVTRPYAPPDR